MTRLRKVLMTLLALSLVRLPLAWLRDVLLPDMSAAPVLHCAVMMAQSLLLFALPGWLLRSEQMRIPKTPASPSGWGFWPLMLALLARLTVVPLNRWWAALLDVPVSAMPMPNGAMNVVIWLLAAVVVPAVSEELFFRGALLGNLLQSGSRSQAVLLTTAMFALMHGNPAGLPGHLIIGLTLSILTLYSGRLAEPIAAHMIYNLLVLIRWEAKRGCPVDQRNASVGRGLLDAAGRLPENAADASPDAGLPALRSDFACAGSAISAVMQEITIIYMQRNLRGDIT